MRRTGPVIPAGSGLPASAGKLDERQRTVTDPCRRRRISSGSDAGAEIVGALLTFQSVDVPDIRSNTDSPGSVPGSPRRLVLPPGADGPGPVRLEPTGGWMRPQPALSAAVLLVAAAPTGLAPPLDAIFSGGDPGTHPDARVPSTDQFTYQ
jgi:hypothetical protein